MKPPLNIHLNHRAPKFLVFSLAGLAILLSAGQVFAQDNIYAGTIPSSAVIENDIVIYGNDVEINGTVEGDVFAGGRTVTVNGEIDGSLIAAGETVTVNGQVGGSVYSAALTLEIGPEAAVGRSAYFLAARLGLKADSQIQRDLVGLALGAESGTVPGRDQRVVIGLVELVLGILDRFNIQTGDLALLPHPVAHDGGFRDNQGKLVYVSGSAANSGQLLSDAGETSFTKYQESGAQLDADDGTNPGEWLLARLRELVTFLVIVGLTAWWFPSAFSRWSLYLRTRPFASFAYGIVTWITCVFGLTLTGVLVLIIGIGLFVAALAALAPAFLGVTVPTLMLAFSIFLIFLLFLSKVIASYQDSLVIFERIFPKAAAYKFWPLLLGLLIYVPLRAIPYFGLVLSIVVTLFGLGAAWLTYTTQSAQPIYLEAVSDETEYDCCPN